MRRPVLPNLAETIAQAALTLRLAGVDDAIVEARILCAALLGVDRAQLLAQDRRTLHPDDHVRLDAALVRRAGGEPIARILGQREFWSLPFTVNAATLVPRSDSETLIDVALTLFHDRRAPLRILDLGSGSGCLLLALLSEFPNATGIGTDIAQDAVKMATQNAAQLGLGTRGKFIATSWSNGISETFDLVISNPPYIASAVIATLDREVRDHDPVAALDGGADGLDAYRALAGILPGLWREGGHALFEIGYDQAVSAAEIFHAAGLGAAQVKRDLAGHPRCLTLCNTHVT